MTRWPVRGFMCGAAERFSEGSRRQLSWNDLVSNPSSFRHPQARQRHPRPHLCSNHRLTPPLRMPIGSGVIAADRTMGARCFQSELWRRSGCR